MRSSACRRVQVPSWAARAAATSLISWSNSCVTSKATRRRPFVSARAERLRFGGSGFVFGMVLSPWPRPGPLLAPPGRPLGCLHVQADLLVPQVPGHLAPRLPGLGLIREPLSQHFTHPAALGLVSPHHHPTVRLAHRRLPFVV